MPGGPGLHAHSARTPAGSELLCSRDCQALPAGLRARGWPPGWVPGPGSAATRSGGWLAAHGVHGPWLWGAGPLWLRVMGSCSFFPLPSWAPPVCLPPSRAVPRAPPASLLIAACKAGCQPASAPRSPLQSANEAPAAAGTCRNLVWLRQRCCNLCELSRWLPKRGLVSTLLPSRAGRTRGRCWALEGALAPCRCSAVGQRAQPRAASRGGERGCAPGGEVSGISGQRCALLAAE